MLFYLITAQPTSYTHRSLFHVDLNSTGSKVSSVNEDAINVMSSFIKYNSIATRIILFVYIRCLGKA